MRFLHGQIKARKGEVIQVHFSQPTRILIMSKREFEKYKNNLTFSYVGGKQEESPYEFTSTKDLVYVVVVEKGSFYDPLDVTASVKVVAGAPSKGPAPEEQEPDEGEITNENDAPAQDEGDIEEETEVVAGPEDSDKEE